MWWKRIATVSLVAGLLVSVVVLGVGATEADPVFEDGYYVLVIPGVGPFTFEVYVDPIGGETVTTWVSPDGYSVDDDDPAKEAWKDAAGLEVEMKLDRIESDVTWHGGVATLTLPGGSITVTEPDEAGDFWVTASGGNWTAFGSGGDWMVANYPDIGVARFFKVEATADGIEIKAVSAPGVDFLNDLEEEEEEEEEEIESEDDGSENANHGKDKNKSKSKNK